MGPLVREVEETSLPTAMKELSSLVDEVVLICACVGATSPANMRKFHCLCMDADCPAEAPVRPALRTCQLLLWSVCARASRQGADGPRSPCILMAVIHACQPYAGTGCPVTEPTTCKSMAWHMPAVQLTVVCCTLGQPSYGHHLRHLAATCTHCSQKAACSPCLWLSVQGYEALAQKLKGQDPASSHAGRLGPSDPTSLHGPLAHA